MQRFGLIYSQNWYISLPIWQKEMVQISLELYSREERLKSSFSDYSFVVFPMAKAYEGFLKSFLYNSGLITREMYSDKHFRIGRSLNPDMNPNRRDEQWVYQALSDLCSSEMARLLWNTWLECRNQIFHFFPDNQKRLTLLEAGQRIEQIAAAIEQAQQCAVQ
jgi:hypothetical protein